MTLQPKGNETQGLKALLETCNFNEEKNKILVAFDLGRLYEKESRLIKNYVTHNCKSNQHKYCNGGSNAWGRCRCNCHG